LESYYTLPAKEILIANITNKLMDKDNKYICVFIVFLNVSLFPTEWVGSTPAMHLWIGVSSLRRKSGAAALRRALAPALVIPDPLRDFHIDAKIERKELDVVLKID
jgi:hypothetical protein